MTINSSKFALLIRPNQDKPTQYSHAWAGALKQALKENGWQVTDCEIQEAIRFNVENALQNQKYDLVIFYGHGSYDSLSGQNNENVLDLQNIQLAKDSVIYVMACKSALQLGEHAIAEGINCYMGYADNVKIQYQFADTLGECVNTGLLAWIEGETAITCVKKMKNKYNQWIDYFALQGDTKLFNYAAILRHNRDCLRLLEKTT